MIVNKIEKDTYIKIVKDKLLNISFEDTTKILNNLIEKLPSELYDVSLCIIDDVLGNSDISLEEINSKYQELKIKYYVI